MNVLVLGPYGSGKSTLVRRLMMPRVWTPVHREGILPRSYRSSDLIVYGNYERNTRTRHGMGALDRDYLAFDTTLSVAAAEPLPGLMEGGFTKVERIERGWGPTFARTAHVIFLNVDGEPKDRLGRKITDNGMALYQFKTFKSYKLLGELGAACEIIQDRQRALERVCEVLGLEVPSDPIEEDYR